MVEPALPYWSHTLPNMIDPDDEKEKESFPTGCAVLEDVVWRKLDKFVLPICSALFVLAGVDQGNIGNARVAGMQLALGMSNYQFTIVLTVTYVSYLASMFPSAVLLRHAGPHIMLPTMTVLFGIVSAVQGFVSDFSGLVACRFFLGLAEGGLFAGIVLYLSFFYPRRRLQIRLAILIGSSWLCNTFSGLLAAAISEISERSGKPGWAWIFILEGIFTTVFGLICFFVLPRSPEKARFFSNEERIYVVSALKRAGSVSEDDHYDDFRWIEIFNGAKSLHVWLLAIVFCFNGAIAVGLGYFEPTIVASLGYTGSQAQLMSVPPFATAFVVSLISAVISDRYQRRGYTMIFFSFLELIGFIMFYASTSNHIRYISLFFSVTGGCSTGPAMVAWISNNSAPYTRRATAVAAAAIMTEVGGIFSTFLLGYLSPGPNYTKATVTFIAMSVGSLVLSIANMMYLWRENRFKMKKRLILRREEERKGLGDWSAWFIYSL